MIARWLAVALGVMLALDISRGQLDVALCWGWIDGQKKSLDDQHYLQRFTPRRARTAPPLMD